MKLLLALALSAAPARAAGLLELERLSGVADPAATFAAPRPRLPASSLHAFRGVIHCHSKLSFDSKGTFEQIADAAARTGVDFVIMTDHPGGGAPEGQPDGMFRGTLFIPGVEMEHLLAIGISHPVYEGRAADVARQIHAQGGLALVAHPEQFSEWGAPGLDGAEIYNLHADLTDEYLPWGFAKVVANYGDDPMKALDAILDFPGPAFKHWTGESAKRPFVGIAANDAHQNFTVFGKQVDPYDLPFRFVSTMVLAPSLDKASILQSLRDGRAFVVFRGFGDSDGFAFEADDGFQKAGIGDTLAARGPVALNAVAPQACEFRLFRDGVLIRKTLRSTAPAVLEAAAPGPGQYRLEVWRREGSRMRPWIVTNPINVTGD